MARRQRDLRLGLGAALSTAVAAVGVWAGTGAAQADPTCTDNWVAQNGGSWDNGANWSTTKAPGVHDVACITLAGTYTVTVGNNQGGDTVAGLVLGGGSSGTQSLTVSGQSYINGMNETGNTVGLFVQGPAQIAANGELTLDSTAAGPAPAGAIAELDTATLANAGTINTQVEGTFSSRIGGAVTNTGTVNVNSGSLVIPSADEGGTGSTGGASFANSGAVNVLPNAELNLDEVQGAGPSSFTQNGTIANQGTVIAQGNGMTWNENGGTQTGNPVHVQNAALLVDSAGAGSFVFDYNGGGLQGTIPAGQTVTVQGVSAITSMNETSNDDIIDLGGKTLTNNGTLNLESTTAGPGGPTGAIAHLQDGALVNAGTFNLLVDSGSTYLDQLDMPVTNQPGANMNVEGKSLLNSGAAFTNHGALTISPGVTLTANGGATFAADGTIIPQIASAASFGAIAFGGSATDTFGGTVAPQLLNGYTPAANTTFAIFPFLGGATLTGSFAAVTGGFSADYSKEATNGVPLTYKAPTPTMTTTKVTTAAPKVAALKASGEKVALKLSCAASGSCARTTVKLTVVEKRIVKVKRKKVTRKVTVTLGSASVTLGAHTTRTLTVGLNAAGRKLLAKDRKLSALLTVTAGSRTLKRATVKLTAPKRKVVKKSK